MLARKEITLEDLEKKTMLTTTEAAVYLGLSKACLEAWRNRGGGPAFVKMQRACRYPKKNLDDFLKACTRHSTSEAFK